jgi:hypothetical protein
MYKLTYFFDLPDIFFFNYIVPTPDVKHPLFVLAPEHVYSVQCNELSIHFDLKVPFIFLIGAQIGQRLSVFDIHCPE